MTTPAEVRSHLIDALQLDLVGPTLDDTAHAEEVLPQSPSKWYLTGFLVPYDAPIEQRTDDTGDEEVDEITRVGSGDDEKVPEKTSARKAFFPSSMGLSILVSQYTTELQVTVCWGDYTPLAAEDKKEEEEQKNQSRLKTGSWQRSPRHAELTVLLHPGETPNELEIPHSGGLKLVVSVRPVSSKELVPTDTRSVSIFLVNHRRLASDEERDAAYTFQTKLIVCTTEPLVPRPDLRGGNGEDWDESVADLQYRDDYEFAVGHNVSAIALTESSGICQKVWTAWMPTADVEKVVPTQIDHVELSMEALAAAPSAAAVRDMLSPMLDTYTTWITEQRAKIPTTPKHRADTANDLLNRAGIANQRIAGGLRAMDDPLVLEAFRIANRGVATAIRQRLIHDKDITVSTNSQVATFSTRLFAHEYRWHH